MQGLEHFSDILNTLPPGLRIGGLVLLLLAALVAALFARAPVWTRVGGFLVVTAIAVWLLWPLQESSQPGSRFRICLDDVGISNLDDRTGTAWLEISVRERHTGNLIGNPSRASKALLFDENGGRSLYGFDQAHVPTQWYQPPPGAEWKLSMTGSWDTDQQETKEWDLVFDQDNLGLPTASFEFSPSGTHYGNGIWVGELKAEGEHLPSAGSRSCE